MVDRVIGPARIIGPPNLPPVWAGTHSNLSFYATESAIFPTSGTYQSNGYVTDPENDPISIAQTAGPALPGLAFDGTKWISSGTAVPQAQSGYVLNAVDSHNNATPSNAFSITYLSPWISTPSPSFVELQAGQTYNVAQHIRNFNAAGGDTLAVATWGAGGKPP